MSELQIRAAQMVGKVPVLKAMSNENRLAILCYLTEGEKTVGEMEKLVGISQSSLSQHLTRLRRHGLVKTRRSATTIYYSLAGAEALAVMETLHDLYCGRTQAFEARRGAGE